MTVFNTSGEASSGQLNRSASETFTNTDIWSSVSTITPLPSQPQPPSFSLSDAKASDDFADFGDFVQPPPLVTSIGGFLSSGFQPGSSAKLDLEVDEWSLPASHTGISQTVFVAATAASNSSSKTGLLFLSASPPPPPDYTLAEPPMMSSSPPPTIKKCSIYATEPVDLNEDFELPSEQLQLSDQVGTGWGAILMKYRYATSVADTYPVLFCPKDPG
jgi:hypothetical protein